MTIERLIKAIPPPPRTFEAFRGPWEPVEAELGVALPPDYKDLVRLYGSGRWMEFLGLGIPGSGNRNLRLESAVKVTSDSFSGLEDLPYPLWPEPGGLIPFGGSDNGDTLFWLPRGAPEDWGIVVWDRGSQTFELFECDLTDFLAGLSTGEILPEAFPPDLCTCDVLFEPHGPSPARAKIGITVANPANASLSFSWRFAGTDVSGVSTCRLRRQG